MRKLTVYATLALFAVLSCALPCAAQQTVKGEWEGKAYGDKLWMSLKSIQSSPYKNHNSFISFEAPDLKKANISIDASGSFPVRFELARDAGTVVIEGEFKDGRGSGSYSFTANPDFISSMKAIGYGELLPDELVRLAVRDVNRTFINEMRSAGYTNATVDNLVRLRNHNITAAFIRETKSGGFSNLPVDQLIRLHNHRISASFIQSLNDVGYKGLSVDQLIRLRNHGVNADFIKQMNEAGNTNLSVEDLIYARKHGTTRERARRMRRVL